MRSIFTWLFALMLPLIAFAAEPLIINQPHIELVSGQTTGAGFVALTNPGTHDVTLSAVRSACCTAVEMHETSMDANGVMSMRQLDSLAIPANRTVTFAPGGMHVMFIGFKAIPVNGDSIPAQLVFKDGSTQPVTFTVGINGVR